MKRTVALLLSALLLCVCVPAMGQVLSLGSDAAALQLHQSELNVIWAGIAAGAEAGFVSTGRAADVQAILAGEPSLDLGNPSQIIQDGDSFTITGGVHFMDVSEAFSAMTLENDAVLINFRATIGTLNIQDNAEYYGLEGSYTQNLTVADDGHVYLYGVYGDLISAGDRGEVNFLDRAYVQDVRLTGDAVGAVLGEAVLTSGSIKENAHFFDPNARVASIVQNGDSNGNGTTLEILPLEAATPAPAEDARGVAANPAASAGGSGGKSASSGKSQKPQARLSPNGTPYSQNIMDWVFNSTPQYIGATGDNVGACECCGCGNPCGDHNGSCCDKCKCFTIPIGTAAP